MKRAVAESIQVKFGAAYTRDVKMPRASQKSKHCRLRRGLDAGSFDCRGMGDCEANGRGEETGLTPVPSANVTCLVGRSSIAPPCGLLDRPRTRTCSSRRYNP